MATSRHAQTARELRAACITVAHWNRVLDGELFASSPRIDWQRLLHRTFGFDALPCPKCSKTMRVLSTITEPSVVRKILRHLGVRAHPLPLAPARDPTGQTEFDFDAAGAPAGGGERSPVVVFLEGDGSRCQRFSRRL